MRTIKFRGKSICEDVITTRDKKICKGDWVYGSLIVDTQPYIVGEIADVDIEFIAPEFWIPIDEKTIGQFTGLHDKNGVEIYEGDIVHITRGLGNFANKKGQVVFTEGAFHIEGQGFTLSFAAQYGLEVIGNIHEEEGE